LRSPGSEDAGPDAAQERRPVDVPERRLERLVARDRLDERSRVAPAGAPGQVRRSEIVEDEPLVPRVVGLDFRARHARRAQVPA
jgi:hypothetical protein